jgi:hypothetical protein
MNKVVIIGAPRSGTNMLRDMLITLPGVGTWPCDEINYIWRHGNVKFPSDEFIPGMAVPKIQDYIRKEFDNLADRYKLDTLIEKTCANSLRVGFVDQVLPDCKYIFIVRDGLDVVGSALERWKASFDFPYILRKSRYVPLTDLPYYASRYFLNHLYRLFSKEKRLAFWGPEMNDVDQLLVNHSLSQVCALQWKKCVDNSERDFSKISADRIIRVSYEEFVKNPLVEFEKIASFLDKKVPNSVKEHLNSSIRSSSVGKGRLALGDDEMNNIKSLISETLERYGYE